MKKTLTSFALSTLFSFNALANDIPNLTAAELSLHRIEKLVTLKKIDETFQSKFKSLLVVPTTQGGTHGFRVIAEQYPGTDGTKNVLELTLNNKGKPLANATTAGMEDPNAPKWPNKDAVVLSELVLHHLEKEVTSNKTLEAFVKSIKSLVVEQEIRSDGTVAAILDLTNYIDSRTLTATILSDGTVESLLILDHAFITGVKDGTCAPVSVHIYNGQAVEVTLKASATDMFFLKSVDLGLDLMASKGGEDKKIVTPNKKGTLSFECGIHGGAKSTKGSFMVM